MEFFKRYPKVSFFIFFIFTFLQANAADLEDPTFADMATVIIRILNYAVIVVGSVFVIMVAYGAFKASMSLGDARGLEGAKQTWVYALYGLGIVLGFSAIFYIVTGFFGVEVSMDTFVGQITGGLQQLFMIAQNGN